MMPDSKRGEIIGAYLICRNERQVSRSTGISLTTVHRWIQSYQETNGVLRLVGSGRPRKTTRRSDRRLFRMARQLPFSSSYELLRAW